MGGEAGMPGLESEGEAKDDAQVSFLAAGWITASLTIHYLL